MRIKYKFDFTPKELSYLDHKKTKYRDYIVGRINDDDETTQLLELVYRLYGWIERINHGNYIQKKSNGEDYSRIERAVYLLRNINRRILKNVDQ